MTFHRFTRAALIAAFLFSSRPLFAGERVVESKTTRTMTRAAIGQPGVATSLDVSGRLETMKPGALAGLHSSGSVAGGEPPGSVVYRNDIANAPFFYRPGAGERMADRLTLASGPVNATGYTLVVIGTGGTGNPTFDVHTDLWNGDPCAPGSVIIAGTGRDFTGLANDGTPVELTATFNPAIAVPGTVYLAVTFGPGAVGDDGGWIVAGEAELGFTPNEWSEQDSASGCTSLFFGCDTYAGFFALVYANVPASATGACCTSGVCTLTTQANCSGTWSGAFTSCASLPCVAGACCRGSSFGTCEETTQGECDDGLFHAGATCGAQTCGVVHAGYANDFDVLGFHRADAPNRPRGDDIILPSGMTCELAGYEITVMGNGTQGPEKFDATVELWTNVVTDPLVELLDRPGVAIPGTSRTFTDIPADLCEKRLVVGPSDLQLSGGTLLPSKFWVVVKTTSAFAGPFLGGPAKLGRSLDSFAQFDSPALPGQWQPGFWFGGFNPEGCPDGETCIPAGSFRVTVWCKEQRPTGACCSDRRETCTDGVTALDCDGRWIEGATCADNLFDPPCGDNACCFPNPVNPNLFVCGNASRETCEGIGGAFSPGVFCEQTSCPSAFCFNAQGNCFATHGNGGCDDAFCCEKVCAEDDFCCTSNWDEVCTVIARDLCGPPANNVYADAKSITGQGAFPFDNTNADTDGPMHEDCETLGDIGGIQDDLWYCWTAPCTDLVTLETCGLTEVDTKVAVYEGCGSPPSDGNLIQCDDDACGFQSRVRFRATQDQQYLIRLGSFPGATDGGGEFPVKAKGSGQFRVSCAGLNHPACPSAGSCCGGTGGPGCEDTLCCNLVCACDPFCCNNEWDEFCAGFGVEGDCGAALLCAETCAAACPLGTMEFTPEDGVVDAGQPADPFSGVAQGIRSITAVGPSGADDSCFTLCETASNGAANGVLNVIQSPNGDGSSTYTITLNRPITPGAVSAITYTDDDSVRSTATYTAHPGNVNGDLTASATDIGNLINRLNGVNPGINAPWGLFSADLDRNNAVSPRDLVRLVDILNGGGAINPAWLNTAKPSTTLTCPPQP